MKFSIFALVVSASFAANAVQLEAPPLSCDFETQIAQTTLENEIAARATGEISVDEARKALSVCKIRAAKVDRSLVKMVEIAIKQCDLARPLDLLFKASCYNQVSTLVGKITYWRDI